MARVSVLLGSDSDLPVFQEAADVLKHLGIDFDRHIISAHRNPHRLTEYVSRAQSAGTKVFIAIAGMSAALPGVVASHSTLPVIGVPVASSSPVMGFDALLSIVQMPPGIPVATVSINGGRNAALLAAQVLSLSDRELGDRIRQYREEMRKRNDRKDSEFRSES